MLTKAFELAEAALAEKAAVTTAEAFQNALLSCGVSYLQVRHYNRPSGKLTSARHWDAGGVLVRYDPRQWVGSESSRYICFDCNPLLQPVARKSSHFDLAKLAPRGSRRFGKYWDAWEDGATRTCVGALAFGTDEEVANIHIGFGEHAVDEDVIRSVIYASSIVAQRLLEYGISVADARPALTDRERDVMTYICEGKTDWETSVILGISEATARFHVDNARRKLGATNRTQAAARFVAQYGLF